MKIDERAKRLLKLLIERYISEGEPVSSSKLAQDQAIALSSATVRNIMSDLEEAGYIRSPHTSAGRVPTAQGYRFFVENILRAERNTSVNLDSLRAKLTPTLPMTELLSSTSRWLSHMTHMAGVVTIPKRSQVLLKQMDLLPLSDNRLLCILVFNERDIENRILYTDRRYTESELKSVCEFINTHFVGRSFDASLKEALLQAMRQDRSEMESLLKAAMTTAEETVTEKTQQKDYLLAGESNLLSTVKEVDVSRLQFLFNAFTQKQDMMRLLDQCLKADGVQIFIGEESGHQAFGDYSVVTAPYKADGEIIGVLGVIGPTRMPYGQVISLVDITSKLLSAALKDEE